MDTPPTTSSTTGTRWAAATPPSAWWSSSTDLRDGSRTLGARPNHRGLEAHPPDGPPQDPRGRTSGWARFSAPTTTSCACAKEIVSAKLEDPPGRGRGAMVVADIAPMADISRRSASRWRSTRNRQLADPALRRGLGRRPAPRRRAPRRSIGAGSGGLPVAYVTEAPSARAPRSPRPSSRTPSRHGARGSASATRWGARRPTACATSSRFTRSSSPGDGRSPRKVDFHNHNDRGLAASSTHAHRGGEGVDRVHGTAGGIGERVGNTAMELQILLNLKLAGASSTRTSPRPSSAREVASSPRGCPSR